MILSICALHMLSPREITVNTISCKENGIQSSGRNKHKTSEQKQKQNSDNISDVLWRNDNSLMREIKQLRMWGGQENIICQLKMIRNSPEKTEGKPLKIELKACRLWYKKELNMFYHMTEDNVNRAKWESGRV